MKEGFDCIQFSNLKKDGSKMRPGTCSPDMHWTYLFADAYLDTPGINIVWTDEGPTLRISKEFVQNNEEGFKKLMSLIKANNIDYEIDEDECFNCPGDKDCLYQKK